MNNVFTAKLLNNLRNKKGNKGFTLIELLVVVIIVGVLAAVALPNLLGQVGKARETEAKNAIGTLNRGQQSFHFDAKTFVADALTDTDFQDIQNPFGVSLISEVYDYTTTAGSGTSSGLMAATPVDATDDGVRGFAGQVDYDGGTGTYGMAVCQGTAIADTPTGITVDIDTPDNNACTGGVIIK
jgi:prepilin-type N-terminal cleavage/methylation domain-containing protein